jgi:heme/copper-type cytochrome/quinol oxidase subunit 3
VEEIALNTAALLASGVALALAHFAFRKRARDLKRPPREDEGWE